MAQEIQISQQVRPTCVAMLVDADNVGQFQDATRLNCMLWGGMLNPIIVYAPDREEECINQLEIFDPDYVYCISAIPEDAPIREHFLEWGLWPSDLMMKEGKLRRMQLCDMAAVIQKYAFSGVMAEPVFAHWSDDHPFALLNCVTVGQYPTNVEPNCGRLFQGLQGVRVEVLDGRAPDQYLPVRGISPLRLTAY